MPSLFRIGKYLVFFWSNENEEPIHVHVSEGRPTPNATKLWLTSKGGCIVANNNSRIPNHDLVDLMDIIEAREYYDKYAKSGFYTLVRTDADNDTKDEILRIL